MATVASAPQPQSYGPTDGVIGGEALRSGKEAGEAAQQLLLDQL